MMLGNNIDSLAEELLDKVLNYYRRPLNEEDRETILAMYASGINITHIALELGYSTYIIRSVLLGVVVKGMTKFTAQARYSRKKSKYYLNRIS